MTVPADPELARTVRRESRVRGMLLGLALGDAALRPAPDDGPLLGTATTQLACATAEGLLRAMVRQNHKGICHEPSMLWQALLRWATRQGIEGVPAPHAVNGWLAGVPALRRRRGDAPATVAALRAGTHAPAPAANGSRGHHALTRLVPLAVGAEGGRGRGPRVARESAVATHGAPGIGDVVATGVTLLGLALAADDVGGWAGAAPATLVPNAGPTPPPGFEPAEGVPTAEDLVPGLDGALRGEPVFDTAPLSARAALLGAAATAVRFPGRDEVARAIAAAAAAPGAEGVAPTTGALLGALHGVEALPGDVWRLELGHVVDTLARDLVVAMWANRDGGEYYKAADPHWAARYPGY